MVLQIGGMLAVFYFLFLRPQAAARKQSESMLAAIKKGDDITTAGGVVGKVRDIREHLITIESGGSTLIVERARIVRVGEQVAGAQGKS